MKKVFLFCLSLLLLVACHKKHEPNNEDITVYLGTDKLYAIDGRTGLARWAYNATCVSLSPAYSNGVVYFGGSGKMYAVKTTDGIKKWEKTLTNREMTGSPVLADGSVFAAGYQFAVDQAVYAWDQQTGAEKWNYHAEISINGPTVAGEWVFILNGGGLYAINKLTGIKQWKFIPGDLPFCNPAIANGVVYFTCQDKKLYAIDANTGLKKWDYTTSDAMRCSPAVANGTVYIASGNMLIAIDAVNGTKKWDAVFGLSTFGSPVVSNQTVYIGSNNTKLMAFDALSGVKKWEFFSGNAIESSPVVAGNMVYFGCNDKKLYALDAATGEKKWTFLTNAAIHEASPCVVIGQQAYYSSVSGMLQ